MPDKSCVDPEGDMSTDGPNIFASSAGTFLDTLAASGKLTQTQVQRCKSLYSKLHDLVLRAYENEKRLLESAKVSNQTLMAEKVKLERRVASCY